VDGDRLKLGQLLIFCLFVADNPNTRLNKIQTAAGRILLCRQRAFWQKSDLTIWLTTPEQCNNISCHLIERFSETCAAPDELFVPPWMTPAARSASSGRRLGLATT
jgi:hypothetical protein